MTYEEFLKFVPAKCIHETLYEDTEGRPILVISMLDAYDMVDKVQRRWVGLTDEETNSLWRNNAPTSLMKAIEAKLKAKNDH